MNSPCQNCTERRLVCHDYCPAYLEYHEEQVRAREALQKDRFITSYLIEQSIRIEKRVRTKRAR